MNIRSLNANFDKLNELLTNYDILPDIIVISETKLKLAQVYNAKLSGYHFYHKGTTTRLGGVGLFIKESLSISICKEFDLNIPNCEDMWIQLDLGNNKKCIDGLQLRHSFFPPKRLDVKTPLQSIGRYRRSMHNSFSGHV